MTNLRDKLALSRKEGHIAFTIEERKPEYVISRMPVAPGVLNPYGIVQAGAMIWLADVTASVLAEEGQNIGNDGKGFPLAIDIHTVLIGNQRDGEIKAEARLVRRGENVVVIRTRVTGNGEKLLAEVTTTHLKAR